jgi:peptidoglycan/LPS O-acetylase OafA/YrhL
LGISWFGVPLPSPVPFRTIAHQIFVEGLLTGYRDLDFLSHWLGAFIDLAPIQQARNPSLWTLHTEFVGSLLAMTLVATRASAGRTVYRSICVVLAFCFLASPLCLFILGHLAAPHLQRAAGGTWRCVLAGLCLTLGVLLSTTPITSLPNDPRLMFGAILVFAGVAQLPTVRRGLETPVLRWFGKISFSLYLTHFPVLFTVIAAAYTLEAAHVPYGASLAIGIVGGIAVSLAIATLFERWIDRPAIRLSHVSGQFFHRVVTPVVTIDAALPRP